MKKFNEFAKINEDITNVDPYGEENWTEVPPYATELIVGKNYVGRADGDFEVRTINQKIYFIPTSPCVDFGEI